MIVITNFADLKEFIGNQTVVNIPINRKNSGGFHQGHIDLINQAKPEADISLVSLWSHTDLFNKIRKEFDESEDWIIQPSEIWNQQYCEQFCIDNGVDVMFIPPTNWFDVFFAGEDLILLNNQVEQILDNNNLTFPGPDFKWHVKTFLVMNYIANKKISQFYYPKTAEIRSIKDGRIILFMKKLADIYFPWNMIIAPISRRPDGLPWDTNLEELNQQEIDMLIDIKSHFDDLFLGNYTVQQVRSYLETVGFSIRLFNKWTYQYNSHWYDFIELSIYVDRIEKSIWLGDHRRV